MSFITDIKLFKQENGLYDIELDDKGNLRSDTGYANALLITFGTNARASSSQVPDPQNRSGWWGNKFNEFFCLRLRRAYCTCTVTCTLPPLCYSTAGTNQS